MFDVYVPMPLMESTSENNVYLFAVHSLQGKQSVTRCSQFSKSITFFDYELLKRTSNVFVKAASSFVVRREDVKPAAVRGSRDR